MKSLQTNWAVYKTRYFGTVDAGADYRIHFSNLLHVHQGLKKELRNVLMILYLFISFPSASFLVTAYVTFLCTGSKILHYFGLEMLYVESKLE